MLKVMLLHGDDEDDEEEEDDDDDDDAGDEEGEDDDDDDDHDDDDDDDGDGDADDDLSYDHDNEEDDKSFLYDNDTVMLMRKFRINRKMMLRRWTDPKPGNQILCKPAQSKCTRRFHKRPFCRE